MQRTSRPRARAKLNAASIVPTMSLVAVVICCSTTVRQKLNSTDYSVYTDRMTVEWHSFGEYRFSFDVRADASRFIIVRDKLRTLLAKGLIEGGLSHAGTAFAIFDEPPNPDLEEVTLRMLEKWTAMRTSG